MLHRGYISVKVTTMYKYLFILLVISTFAIPGCAPERDDEFSLPPTPEDPLFSVEMVQGDSNRFVIRDLSEGSFQRFWNLPGGTPKTSMKAVDKLSLYLMMRDDNDPRVEKELEKVIHSIW